MDRLEGLRTLEGKPNVPLAKKKKPTLPVNERGRA